MLQFLIGGALTEFLVEFSFSYKKNYVVTIITLMIYLKRQGSKQKENFIWVLNWVSVLINNSIQF